MIRTGKPVLTTGFLRDQLCPSVSTDVKKRARFTFSIPRHNNRPSSDLSFHKITGVRYFAHMRRHRGEPSKNRLPFLIKDDLRLIMIHRIKLDGLIEKMCLRLSEAK